MIKPYPNFCRYDNIIKRKYLIQVSIHFILFSHFNAIYILKKKTIFYMNKSTLCFSWITNISVWWYASCIHHSSFSVILYQFLFFKYILKKNFISLEMTKFNVHIRLKKKTVAWYEYAICTMWIIMYFWCMCLFSQFILFKVLQVYYEFFFVCFINIYLMCISDLNRNKLPGINIIS